MKRPKGKGDETPGELLTRARRRRAGPHQSGSTSLGGGIPARFNGDAGDRALVPYASDGLRQRHRVNRLTQVEVEARFD